MEAPGFGAGLTPERTLCTVAVVFNHVLKLGSKFKLL
jgi:hypothetical protein